MIVATARIIRIASAILAFGLVGCGSGDSNEPDIVRNNGVADSSESSTAIDSGESITNSEEPVNTGDSGEISMQADQTANLPTRVEVNLGYIADKIFRLTWSASQGVEYYKVLENADGVSGFSDISGELAATTETFDHRIPLYARVNAQYLVQACSDEVCVDSEPTVVTGSLEGAVGYFKASNVDESDQFGQSVSLSSDGNTMAVGVPYEDGAAAGIDVDQSNDGDSFNSGAVYVFARSDGRWQQQAYIKASNPDADDRFGQSVSLSSDGNTLAVGAPREDSAATGINGDQSDSADGENAGAVYVFTRNTDLWQQQAYIKASNSDGKDGPADEGDLFGHAVSLSGTGNALAVGAFGEDSDATGIDGDQGNNTIATPNQTTGFASGAVYVFVRNNGFWEQQAYVKASNTDGGHEFGTAVSLNLVGDTLAVGAPREFGFATGVNGDQTDNSELDNPEAGAVYVFAYSRGIWRQQAYIKASNTGARDRFGGSVTLSGDGDRLAIGATQEASIATGINSNPTDNSAPASGAVYVFARSNSLWQQQAYVKASNTDERDRFGHSVSFSSDGNVLAVGAWTEDSGAIGINGDHSDNAASGSGAVYIFVSSNGFWRQQAYVKASNSDARDGFGYAVCLSADGNSLAIGARDEDSNSTGINGDPTNNSAGNSGAVYMY